MVKKETFVNICKLVDMVEEKNDADNSAFEKLFNTSFHGEEDCFDTRLMYIWPLEAAQEALKIVVLDMGETEEGADWFVYEGKGQIANYGSTAIDDVTITSYEDYYDWVVKEYGSGDSK